MAQLRLRILRSPGFSAVLIAGATACGTTPPRPAAEAQPALEQPSPAPSLEGRWEGEIETPRRPLVLYVDLDSAHARLSATGSIAIRLQDLNLDGDSVRFQLHLGRDSLSVRAGKDPTALRGTAWLLGGVHPIVLSRLPDLARPANREEAWRQDLDIVLRRFLPYDRSFTPSTRTAFAARISQLRDSAAMLSDERLKVELARAVALSDNAHTRLYLVRNRTEVRRMPIRIWPFADGYHVVRATAAHRDLLGCRIARIDDMGIDAAVARVRGIKPGNAQWQRYMSSYMLTSAEILSGAGITSNADPVRYDFTCGGRPTSRDIVPLPLERSSATTEAWWDLSPNSAKNLVVPHSPLPQGRVPLYLRNPDVHYWFEFPTGRDVLYLQYNRAQNTPGGESLADFQRRLLDSLQRRRVGTLALDLRFNTGGNMDIATPLMSSLRERFRGRRVFVITGPATFSAGISHAAQWKEWGATIVGEPVGDELDAWGEGGNVELPNSGLIVHFSNGFHAYSRRPYPEIPSKYAELDVESLEPAIAAPLSWRQYISGRDPAMETILAAASRR